VRIIPEKKSEKFRKLRIFLEMPKLYEPVMYRQKGTLRTKELTENVQKCTENVLKLFPNVYQEKRNGH
jgi:hypothetical protein